MIRKLLPVITLILGLVVGLIAVSGVVVGILAFTNAERASHKAERASQSALSASRTALKATHEIKSSRVNSILTSCREQNERHDKTIMRANVVLDAESRTLKPAERVGAEQQREFVVLLVGALAPKKNCQQRARQLTKP